MVQKLISSTRSDKVVSSDSALTAPKIFCNTISQKIACFNVRNYAEESSPDKSSKVSAMQLMFLSLRTSAKK